LRSKANGPVVATDPMMDTLRYFKAELQP